MAADGEGEVVATISAVVAAMSDECGEELQGCCSVACTTHPRKRPYNLKGYYSKQSDNYTPEFGFKSRKLTPTP